MSASPGGTIRCKSLRFVSPTESDRAWNKRKGIKRLGQASDICLCVMTIVVRLEPFGRVGRCRGENSPWTDTRCSVQIGRFGVIVCGRWSTFLSLIAFIVTLVFVHLDFSYLLYLDLLSVSILSELDSSHLLRSPPIPLLVTAKKYCFGNYGPIRCIRRAFTSTCRSWDVSLKLRN